MTVRCPRCNSAAVVRFNTGERKCAACGYSPREDALNRANLEELRRRQQKGPGVPGPSSL